MCICVFPTLSSLRGKAYPQLLFTSLLITAWCDQQHLDRTHNFHAAPARVQLLSEIERASHIARRRLPP